MCSLVGNILTSAPEGDNEEEEEEEAEEEEECYLAHSVRYHTVYVKRCQSHCGTSQKLQAPGSQKAEGACRYDHG